MRLALALTPALDAKPCASAMLEQLGVRVVDRSTHQLILAMLRAAFQAGGSA